MKDTNMESSYVTKPQDEFVRQVLFLKDDDKILAVFPFYHNISDVEYNVVIENFYEDQVDDDIPSKNEFCLMYEIEFGWGWIHNRMITHLDVAKFEEYEDFRNILVDARIIRKIFVLNEE